METTNNQKQHYYIIEALFCSGGQVPTTLLLKTSFDLFKLRQLDFKAYLDFILNDKNGIMEYLDFGLEKSFPEEVTHLDNVQNHENLETSVFIDQFIENLSIEQLAHYQAHGLEIGINKEYPSILQSITQIPESVAENFSKYLPMDCIIIL